MTAEERREFILKELLNGSEIISANTFAKDLDVSRQIIVGDIALLRALGYNIEATPKGYFLGEASRPSGVTKIVCSNHKKNQMMEELYTVVDNGGAILDVQIEHHLYGKLIGAMNLYSRYDIEEFAAKIKKSNAILLSGLTDGQHEHTIWCNDEKVMDRVILALQEKGLIV
ncbi:transcription repressor NadR [Hespellia stercorisuis]|uniref:Transcription repressor NadR n=1 Tax=Hespellia stercorisuis DSM 15480 TaxID=1121950 RepID=A0A1M6VDF1_9FIRM|nr:transcription repressor NadR [Hespellia stercorisuis]SHK79557.1 hypothetical protein SAMN02745243_03744 [Hespellia stercorisuis DSM 15480]